MTYTGFLTILIYIRDNTIIGISGTDRHSKENSRKVYILSLTSSEKQKYVLGCRRLELGTWGYAPSVFRKLHLTTKAGNDNTAINFSKDFRKLIRWMKTKVGDVEYCGALGYTPKNNLIHGHFIIRVKYGYVKLYDGYPKDDTRYWFDERGDRHSEHEDANRRALGDAWNKYHGAFVVGMLGRFSESGEFIKYITSHVMKDYMSYKGNESVRFLKSKRWDWRCKNGMVTQFRNWWRDTVGTSYLSENGGFELLYQFQKRMCEGRTFKIVNDKGEIQVHNYKAYFGMYAELPE